MWKKLKSIFSRSVKSVAEVSSRTDTEFTAEIVRVTQLLPHPNADRLEIARFEMKGLGETSYEVVIQKGTMAPGDLVAYFSVDCVVPTSHPDFKFLTERKDGAGKAHYRLRAARLRGVYSQGLLVPAGNFLQYGDNVAALFGVTYHNPIGSFTLTETGTPKYKQPKVQPCPVYGVDSLKKMPRLFGEGEQVCITEKIHGCNFRFGWVRRKVLGVPLGWKFVVGSHRTMRTGNDLWTQAADRMNLKAISAKCKGLMFYGELYGHTYDGEKIQDLTYGTAPQDGPSLAIFDVRHMGEGYWLDAWDRFDLCVDLHLEHVPVLNACISWTTNLAELMVEPKLGFGTSTLDSRTVREGVVVEALQGTRRKAKYVSEAYLMRKGG